jgi:hypothetical protein
MAAPTAGYITIMDPSLAGLTDEDSDPDGITLANPGVDYCELGIPEGWQHKLKGNPKIRSLFGGKSYFIKNGKIQEDVRCTGIVVSTTNLNYIMNYFKKHILSGSNNDFICIKYTTNDYHDFHDENDVERNLAPGVFTDLQINWSNDENRTHSINIIFKIAW